MESGIYKIVNTQNGKLYIGSAININRRWNEHKSELRGNKHHSPRLQNSYNKYGEENFIFEIIEEIEDKEKLIEREQYWLDYYKSYDKKRGFNICLNARSCLGVERTEEYKQKISVANKGKKHSEEAKKKIGENARNRVVSEETRRKDRKSVV